MGVVMKLFGIAIVFALCAVEAAAATVSVKSFNIRNSNQSSWNGFGSGDDRRDRVMVDILRPAPGEFRSVDILGLQEVTPEQYRNISEDLTSIGYVPVGVAREEGGEAAPIFYDANKFSQQDAGQFNLSLTPDLPGSVHILDADNEPPRIATWVILKDRVTGQEIVAVNTHFPQPSSGEARAGASLADLQSSETPEDYNAIEREISEINRLAASDGALGQAFGKDLRFQQRDLSKLDYIPGASDILAAEIQRIAGDRPIVLTGDFNTGVDRQDPVTGELSRRTTGNSARAHGVLTGEVESEFAPDFGLVDTYIDAIGGFEAYYALGDVHGTQAAGLLLDQIDVITGEPTSTGDPDTKFELPVEDTIFLGKSRIDYIFASDFFEVEASVIEQSAFLISDNIFSSSPDFWQLSSDHWAVTTVLSYGDDDNPNIVPLPSGLPMTLTGIAMLGWTRKHRKPVSAL